MVRPIHEHYKLRAKSFLLLGAAGVGRLPYSSQQSCTYRLLQRGMKLIQEASVLTCLISKIADSS